MLKTSLPPPHAIPALSTMRSELAEPIAMRRAAPVRQDVVMLGAHRHGERSRWATACRTRWLAARRHGHPLQVQVECRGGQQRRGQRERQPPIARQVSRHRTMAIRWYHPTDCVKNQ
jgi:hypothetical protein